MGRGAVIATVGSASWGRVVERLCFLFPPVVGAGVVGLVRTLGVPSLDPVVPAISFLDRGLVVLGAVGYAVLSIGMAIALFLDAREIRDAGVGSRRPRPRLAAAFGLVLAPAAGAYYLLQRHREFGTPAGRSRWWLVVAASLATTLAGTAIAGLGVALSAPGVVAAALGVAGAVAVGAFPVAIHRDAAYVCTRSADWQPNPGGYLGLAFLSLVVPVCQPLLAAYYLQRRRRAVGLSP